MEASKKKTAPRRSRKEPGYIPRPLNSWVCFVKDKEVSQFVRDTKPSDVGHRQYLSSLWQTIGADGQRRFEIMAINAAIKHKQMYPEYKFLGRRKKDELKEDSQEISSAVVQGPQKFDSVQSQAKSFVQVRSVR